jgi:hypothetical protein
MPIKVTNIYVSKDLQRSHDNGYFEDILAEASVVVTVGGAPQVWEYAGLKIRSKADGSGFQVLSPSQKLDDGAGGTKYQPLFSIPKEWYQKVNEAVLSEFAKWQESGGVSTPADDDELQDPFLV